MNKNKNRYSRSKCVFVCASAILSLWLGATWTNNVKAAEVDANQAANNTEQTQQNTDHVTANKQDKTKKNEANKEGEGNKFKRNTK